LRDLRRESGPEVTSDLDRPRSIDAPVTSRYGHQVKLSVNVPPDVGERLRALAFEHRLSGSSIIQVALRQFFARGDDTTLGVLLRELGASLRRR
jgi:hypothetical protein